MENETHIVEVLPAASISEQSELYMNYHFTAEAAYRDIKINQSKLIYTYFEDVEGKCEGWVAQIPCWTGEDLTTKEVPLSEEEISDLIRLINQTGFMNLENRYGPDSISARCYPLTLSVKIGKNEKEVVYCDRPIAPVSPPMPEAFKKVKDKLFELVDKNFMHTIE